METTNSAASVACQGRDHNMAAAAPASTRTHHITGDINEGERDSANLFRLHSINPARLQARHEYQRCMGHSKLLTSNTDPTLNVRMIMYDLESP